MFYKVLGYGIPNVAEHCFTNGLLDLFEVTKGWNFTHAGLAAARGARL